MNNEVKKAEMALMREYIYLGVRNVLAEPGIEKKSGKDAIPYMVDRVLAFVSKQMGQNDYYTIYTILFDHLFDIFLQLKKEAQEANAKKHKNVLPDISV